MKIIYECVFIHQTHEINFISPMSLFISATFSEEENLPRSRKIS
jgi:hypothetical protein